MFGSQILDVAVGLVLVFLLVSLVASVVNEWIARATALRASTLEDGLRNLLQDPKTTATSTSLLDYLYNHPLIQGASPLRSRGRRLLWFGQDPPRGTTTAGMARTQAAPSAEALTRAPLGAQADAHTELGQAAASDLHLVLRPPEPVALDNAATRTGRPSYINSRVFSLALLDLVAPVGLHSNDFEKLKIEISNIPNPRLQRTLLSLVNSTQGDIEHARANIESWFNNGMDRVSGWYKRKVQIIGLCVGLVLAIVLNADTLAIVRTLWTQPSVREALSRSAEQYVLKSAPPDISSATVNFDAQRQKLQESLGGLSASNLPIGWILEVAPAPAVGSGSPQRTQDSQRLPDVLSSPTLFLSKIVGLLLTGAAVSLGSNFWFNALKGIASLRSGGDPPPTTSQTA